MPEHPRSSPAPTRPAPAAEGFARQQDPLDALVGPRPDNRSPIWTHYPYWSFPTGRIDDPIRGRLWRVSPEAALCPDEPLFPERPGDRHMLRRGERACAVYLDGEAIASHTGERIFVAFPNRRRGIGLALARVMVQERWWQVGVRYTPEALRVHQRAYRHVILDARRRGETVHPAILELLALAADGTVVHFTSSGPRLRLGAPDSP